MTDEEMLEAWINDRGFDVKFDEAVQAREQEIPTASNARLAELLLLAERIDCYYGPQDLFLSLCAREAAKRLGEAPSSARPKPPPRG